MRSKGTNGGFSLVEVMVVTAIFSLAMLAVSRVVNHSQRDYTDYTVGTEIRDRQRAVLDRMETELSETCLNSPNFYFVDGSGTIIFNRCSGFNGTDPVWSTPITYALTPQETLTRTQDGTTLIMATSVTGLSFTWIDGTISIQLSIAKEGATGRRITQAMNAVAFMRNN